MQVVETWYLTTKAANQGPEFFQKALIIIPAAMDSSVYTHLCRPSYG